TALFYLLDGKPKQRWEQSVVLRRILYNCCAYPFMKIFEHDLGGLVCNGLITMLAFVLFALFALRTIGQTGAIAGMWLLAPYPGIHYYVGQPFLYALIVPGCLLLYIMLWNIYDKPSFKNVCIVSLGMGLLFTGYDFMPLFGPVALMILVVKKKSPLIVPAVAGMLLCTVVWWVLLRLGLGGTFASENSDIYKNLLQSYLHPPGCSSWAHAVIPLPGIMCANAVFSCFFFLPLLFGLSALVYRKKMPFVDVCIIAVALLIMMVNNCSPPSLRRWDLRGVAVARIYQPIFVVMLFHVMRTIQTAGLKKSVSFKTGLLLIATVATILGNAVVALGPICNDPYRLSSSIYWRFYRHSPPSSMKANLAQYGRRPWGFCN
ncbi:MAG TPA: hypothetical protein VF335_03425, partial [Chitinivibrionales bacterium]